MKKITLIIIPIIILIIIYFYIFNSGIKNIEKSKYFVEEGGKLYTMHFQLYGSEKFLVKGIDYNSTEIISDNFFKDKNGVYFLESFKGKYVKVDADINSFKKVEFGLMEDNKCYFLGKDCIDKNTLDKNIEIKLKNNFIFIDYKGKKEINSFMILDGNSIDASILGKFNKLPLKIKREKVNNILFVRFSFKDNTDSYNIKKIKK